MKLTKIVTLQLAVVMTLGSGTPTFAQTPANASAEATAEATPAAKTVAQSEAATENAAGAPEKKSKRKPSSLERPPQFVLLAFDGSLSNDFWKESQDFADSVPTVDSKGQKTTLKFTYFVNPPYYLDPAKKSAYSTPGLNKPVSCIGWAKGPEGTSARDSIVPRVDLTNRAYKRGHEIGSHANSHCDQTGTDRSNPMYGRPWGLAEWRSEFRQFNTLLFDVFRVNGLQPSASNPKGFEFKQSEIVGFRAPLLGHTPPMWQALKEYGFRYDTSKSSEPTYWPQRHPTGIWNFPLGMIKIAGTDRKTYSMDYNWLCRQSACVSKPGLTDEERLRFKNQMLDSYKYYFKINYFGGRGPLHIGHHFSKWNRGAYWDAMKEFARFVCNKPEVRCVTNVEYLDWIESLPRDTYEAYRAGKFDRLRDDNTIRNISTPVLADVRLEEDDIGFQVATDLSVEDRMPALGWRKQLSIDFKPLDANEFKIAKADLISKAGVGSSVIVRASLVSRSGAEINSSSYRIDKLGTAEEVRVGPLEDRAMQGETAEAHTTPE